MDIFEVISVQGLSLPIYGTVEEPLFLATDVAKMIDYSVGNTAHMLGSVDSREKTLLSVRNSSTSARGNATDKWFLTEYGLYEVLMQSRKPVARRFKNAVKDILHDLRIRGEGSLEDWLNYGDPLVEEWEEVSRELELSGREPIDWEDFLRSKGYTDDMLNND